MTPTEMENLCRDSLAGAKDIGIPEEMANITLVTPKGWKAPPRFPRGCLLQVKDNGDRLWHFPTGRVMAWLRAAQEAA